MVTTDRNKDPLFEITDIPPQIWERFRENAEKMMPERKDKAWASAIMEFVGRVAGNKATYVMTDIPVECADGLEAAAREANLTTDALLKEMWESAARNRIHIINFTNSNAPKDTRHTLIFTNLMDEAVKAWATFGAQTGVPFAHIMGRLMEAAANGALQYRQWDASGKLNTQVHQGDDLEKAFERDKNAPDTATAKAPDPGARTASRVSGGSLEANPSKPQPSRPQAKQQRGAGDSGRSGAGDRAREPFRARDRRNP